MSFKIEKDFIHNGLRCVVVATDMGHRCGYVGVPKEHKAYGFNYSDVEINNNIKYKFKDNYYEVQWAINNIDVHGGLTFSDNGEKKYPIEDDVWWFGFDCGHSCDGKDYSIMSEETKKIYSDVQRMFYSEGSVKSTEYVEKECIILADQLVEIGKNKMESL